VSKAAGTWSWPHTSI